MAVVRARTSPPYALIIFVILWVISTGIAVFLYTQQSKLTEDKVKAEKSLAEVVRGPERAEVAKLIAAGGKNATALGEAINQIKQLRKVVSGNPEDSTYAIVGEQGTATRALAAGQYPSLLAGISTVEGKLLAATGAAEASARELAASKEVNENQRKKFEEDRRKMDEVLASAKDEIAKITAESTRAKDDLKTAGEGNQAQITELTEKHAAEVRRLNLVIAQLEADKSRLNNRITTLTNIIEGLRPRGSGKVIAQANGTIIRTSAATNEVYINLGRSDRVVPGLTFSVHDPRLGIQTDAANAKGKGGIEVIEVGDRESLCRVTHLEKNQRMQPSDLIYNLVFTNDKTRKFRFVVYGDFDIDGDGKATSGEREKIVGMIKSWGGDVDQVEYVDEIDPKTKEPRKVVTLSPQTDYVVLGTAPRVPQSGKIEDMDEASKGVFESQLAKAREYDRIESEAKRSTVPVLNANRFLNMIGYYNTTLIRY